MYVNKNVPPTWQGPVYHTYPISWLLISWWRKNGASAAMVLFLLSQNFQCSSPGVYLNIKMSSYQYRNFHHEDETVSQPSYLYDGNPLSGKTVLYWDRPRRANTLMLELNGAHFADNIFTCIGLNKDHCNLIKSLFLKVMQHVMG